MSEAEAVSRPGGLPMAASVVVGRFLKRGGGDLDCFLELFLADKYISSSFTGNEAFRLSPYDDAIAAYRLKTMIAHLNKLQPSILHSTIAP